MGAIFQVNQLIFPLVQFLRRRCSQEILRPCAFSHCLPPRFTFKLNIYLRLQDTLGEWFFSQSFARYKMRGSAMENGS